MKNKIISIIILIMIIFSLLVLNYHVEAYSGEIDPENYITMPSSIFIQNKVGTGNIILSSSATEYNISYQKIDISTEELNNLQDKTKEIEDYVKEINDTKTQKESELTKLQNDYTNLQNSETATEEEITEAYNKYNTAYTEYEEFINTANTQIEKLKSECYDLIPDYTNSWQTSTDSSNNIQLDFSDYSGTANFVLWVKITNGTNTYYDVEYYSTAINNEETDDSGDDEQDNLEEWTNFSKAKFELIKSGTSDAVIEATGVTPSDDSSYYLYITNNSNKPDISKITDDEKINFIYDKETEKFSASGEKVASKVELNQDLYVVVIEHNNPKGTDNVVSYGTKLSRYDEAKYNDAFHATFMTYETDQIITTFTHAKENNRKIKIKIGKVTDISILKKLRDEDSSGFSDLMSYAKSNTGIYEETLNADANDSYAIEYNAGAGYEENDVIKLNGLENEAYYYLYIKTDDENGKYISNEAVTFAQASTFPDGKWYMFFYGTSDFKWVDLDYTSEEDTTVADEIIPHTGISYVVTIAIVLFITLGVVARIKYKKYDF